MTSQGTAHGRFTRAPSSGTLSRSHADDFGPVLTPLKLDLLRQNLPKFELAAALLSTIEGHAVEGSVDTQAVGKGKAAESDPSAGHS